jgi:hypothetical protein
VRYLRWILLYRGGHFDKQAYHGGGYFSYVKRSDKINCIYLKIFIMSFNIYNKPDGRTARWFLVLVGLVCDCFFGLIPDTVKGAQKSDHARTKVKTIFCSLKSTEIG